LVGDPLHALGATLLAARREVRRPIGFRYDPVVNACRQRFLAHRLLASASIRKTDRLLTPTSWATASMERPLARRARAFSALAMLRWVEMLTSRRQRSNGQVRQAG